MPESGRDILLFVFCFAGWIDYGEAFLKPDTPCQVGQAMETIFPGFIGIPTNAARNQ